jgi:hypothetical protein
VLDLHNAYSSIPIHLSEYHLTGLCWKFGLDKNVSHFLDVKLPLRAVKSCQVFQRLTDSLVYMMTRRNYLIFAYLDYLLCMDVNQLDCKDCYDELGSLIESLGQLLLHVN